MKLLLLDDDPQTLDDLKSSLEPLNYDCFAITSPKEALEIYKEQKFDLVISDLKMPDMSGLDFMKKLRDIDEKARVIIITGYPNLDDILDAIKNKGYAFLKKPINFERFIQILNKIETEIVKND